MRYLRQFKQLNALLVEPFFFSQPAYFILETSGGIRTKFGVACLH
jgi:hypothetical protein